MSEITYQEYDDKNLIVFGDRPKFQKHINLIGGRWNSKKDGWVLPLNNKNKLENFIHSIKENGTLPKLKKYNREEIDSESESDASNSDGLIELNDSEILVGMIFFIEND